MNLFTKMIIAMGTLCSLSLGAQQEPKKAMALLIPTKGNKAQGIVSFTETPNGVLIVADLVHLEPGKHGLQVHEYGDCSDPAGRTTGSIYNPLGARHGSPDSTFRQIGCLGNVVADELGNAHYERLDHTVKLSGSYNLMGKAIVVHSNADDYSSQPNGNVGGCIACGIID